MKKKKLNEIKQFIQNENLKSKIYLGCDSKTLLKKGEWYAEYFLVVVIHKNCSNGCKIFGDKVVEKLFDYNRKVPRFRLMKEVYLVSDLYLQLAEILEDREVEIHLDISPNKKNLSSTVVQEAIGYVKGVTNMTPCVKPNAWASSSCADKIGRCSSLKELT